MAKRGDILADRVVLPSTGASAIEMDGSTGIATFGADTQVDGARLRSLDHRIPGARRLTLRKLAYAAFLDPGTSKTVDIWAPALITGVTNDPVVVDVFCFLNDPFFSPAASAIEFDVGDSITPDTQRYINALDVFAGSALPASWHTDAAIKGADLISADTIILPVGQTLTATLRIVGDVLNNLNRGTITVLWSYYHLPTLP